MSCTRHKGTQPASRRLYVLHPLPGWGQVKNDLGSMAMPTDDDLVPFWQHLVASNGIISLELSQVPNLTIPGKYLGESVGVLIRNAAHPVVIFARDDVSQCEVIKKTKKLGRHHRL